MTSRKISIISALATTAAILLWAVCGRTVAAETVYPVQNAGNWFTRHIASRAQAIFTRAQTAAENLRLKREIEALKMVRADAETLAAENARLRQMLGLQAETRRLGTNAWICAPILSRGGGAGNAAIAKAGKGSLAGITPGSAVATPEGLVGRVSEVSPHTATIELITSPKLRVACEIETGDPVYGSIPGILSGGGAFASPEAETSILYILNPLRIRHLGRAPDLPPRAKIVTSGLGGAYPRGITVGFLIDGQGADEAALEREGDAVPAVDFQSLDYVFIRRNEK